jgi:hypothetical protein
VLFSYLDEFCTAYVNDILIFSENSAKHYEHVIQMLEKLKSAGLQANIKKSEFFVTKTKFLKYIICTKGIAVDSDKISAVMKWERPTKVKELQSFLGFCNFYRLFIKDFSRVAKLLHRLTAAIKWKWTQKQQRAFDHLKQALTSALVLVHFDETRATKLETDASDGVISGALSQLTDQKEWHPVAFFSKIMNPAQCNYFIYDKELLVIMLLLKKWEQLLIFCRSPFDIYTDYQLLQYFAIKRQLNARQAS